MGNRAATDQAGNRRADIDEPDHESGTAPFPLTTRPSGAMAMVLAALAMIAIAGFWMIGTEPAQIARSERARELSERAETKTAGRESQAAEASVR